MGRKDQGKLIDLAACKVHFKESLRPATICFVVADGAILLGRKKRGFGQGLWNVPGGKVEAGEGIEQAAIRETREEVGISPTALRKAAVLDFYFPEAPARKEWSQRVHVFLVDDWEGEVIESDEMVPAWFSLNEIPYDQMWEDDVYWLPALLDGKFVTGDFLFDGDDTMKDHEVVIYEHAEGLHNKTD